MSGTRIPRVLFFAIVLAAIAQCVHDFPLLPDRLASHFGASGIPNGWMTKSQFFITFAIVLLPALAVEFWVSHRIAKNPDARLKLPNKEYWLAPERRVATSNFLAYHSLWLACLAVCFVSGLELSILQANRQLPPHLPMAALLAAVGPFLAGTVFWVLVVMRHFRRVN
jgi:uncharacterized membrane protein